MIIGFTGKARHGKSTCADYLVEKYGFVKINFKDALVKEMRDRLPDTLQALLKHYNTLSGIDDLFKEKPPIMRELMQNYGTDIRRKDRDDYWTEKWNKEVSKAIENGKNIVTDDCRFINEADAVKNVGGIVTKIICWGNESKDNPSHISETEMDSIEIDQTIYANKGDVETLYKRLDQIIKDYDKGK